jgi:glycine oxidase
MQEKDYIVVGLGIAGLAICESIENRNKSFMVFDTGEESSTKVSGGVFNPVVLKWLTVAWEAKKHLESALNFYQQLSKKLNIDLLKGFKIYRIFSSIEEQNNWMAASDKRKLRNFISSELVINKNGSINAPHGLGEVTASGGIFPAELIAAYRLYLKSKDALVSEAFDYNLVLSDENSIRYKNILAKKIIFAEGVAAIRNPYFQKKLLIGNKGEYLIIKSPELKLDRILKSSIFLIPLGEDTYKVGATYQANDFTYSKTDEAKNELLYKLDQMIHCPYELIDHVVGVRPTTLDRKPLMGSLPNSKNMVFLNGLGARGIMTAPTMAKILVDHLEENIPLPVSLDINRSFD